jgi:hypothetical protein
MTSHTEQLARDLLRHYQPRLRQILNFRPDWLRNPETGRNLELDIYLPDIQAAIEVQGVQHGRPIKGLQRDFAAFEKQQRHDRYKREVCLQHGITLYSLTIFDLTQPRFAPWYVAFVNRHGLKFDRYAEAPHHLFAKAERLSRAKVVTRPSRKPTLRRRFKRFLLELVK